MSVPVRNIYHMLWYAWRHYTPGTPDRLGAEDSPDLLDLFANIVIEQTTHLLHRGLYRGYVTHEEALQAPRGKPLITPTISQALMPTGRIACAFDELTHDVLPNQIIKTAIARLRGCSDLDKDLRRRLGSLDRRLTGISEIRPDQASLGRLVIHRHNAAYGFVLHVCQLLLADLMPEDATGKYRFHDFTRDTNRMGTIFEVFLRRFYEHHRAVHGLRVGGRHFDWQEVEGSPEDRHFLPQLETDIELVGATRHIVADAKFYASPLSGRTKPTLNRDHLFQLYAYLQNAVRRENSGVTPEGMLIYAAVEGDFDLRYSVHGFPVRAVAIDLTRPWQEIEDRLLHIITEKPMQGSPTQAA